uniref:Transmembrane and ubiquitin-like domain-containing protein 1 n=2 Tax=Sus scrofa TaxID=9823 RepID=A0A4X1USG5_PIG
MMFSICGHWDETAESCPWIRSAEGGDCAPRWTTSPTILRTAGKRRVPPGVCDLATSRPEVPEGPLWSWRSRALGSPAGKAGAMALIEGVGDEVTILFAVLACLLVLALAWVSTHTAEGVDPLSQPSGTPPSTQPSEAMAVTDSIRGEAPGAETPSLRHRGQAAQPESGMGLPATPPPQDSPQEPLVLRLKFLNDSEQVARAWPHDTIGSLKRTQFPGREQHVRLIYQGQLLGDDTQTLGSLHLPPNCVLHCHVSTRPPWVWPASPYSSVSWPLPCTARSASTGSWQCRWPLRTLLPTTRWELLSAPAGLSHLPLPTTLEPSPAPQSAPGAGGGPSL